MRLHVTHHTLYRYSLPARSSINELRLSPEHTDRQSPSETRFEINPTTKLSSTRDLFGNLVHHFEVEEKHPALSITSTSTVETLPSFSPPETLLHQPLQNPADLQLDDRLRDFLTDSNCIQRDPQTWREALDLQANATPTWSALLEKLNNHIFQTCHYQEQHLHTMRTATQVQRERTGTCQDFAHLLISYLRLLHIPARYTSGYLYDPGLDHNNQPQLIGSGTTHAWVEAFLPDFGWLGIDPTNNCWVNDHYISLAFGRDYHDVVPIRGSFLGGGKNRDLEVSIQIHRLDQS
ncbi:MAG: transglutaminase family protein [Verrucomicrobiota bacterium]